MNIFYSLLCLALFSLSYANHGHSRSNGGGYVQGSGRHGGGSGRGGSGNNGNPDGPPPDGPPPSSNTFSLECSSSTSTNAYCDQMLESLLGLVVGVPSDSPNSPSLDSNGSLPSKTSLNQMLSQLKVRSKPATNAQGQIASDNVNVTQICCFLTSFPSARENCCNQITNFCQDVATPSSCGCYGGSGYGGGGGFGGNGGGGFGGGHTSGRGGGEGWRHGSRGGGRGGGSPTDPNSENWPDLSNY